MVNDEEEIRQDMEKTRESLTDKLETLENKLIGSVQEASSAVRETVSSVKETMHESVESVKSAVDVPAHVDHHPWVMFGGAVLGGMILGSLINRVKAPAVVPMYYPPPPPTPIARQTTAGNGHLKSSVKQELTSAPVPMPTSAPAKPSMLSAVEPEINQLKGLALGMAMGAVRELLSEQVPPQLADQVRNIIDGVTKKIGGEPLSSDELPFTKPASAYAETHAGQFHIDKPRW